MTTNSFTQLTDRELLEATVRIAGDERRVTAELLALLGELDARRLYLDEGCSSLFVYCTQVLRLSEHAAYHRIEAARSARQFPIILSWIREGALTLTTVALLRPRLTAENHEALLTAARHRSKRDVDEGRCAFVGPRGRCAETGCLEFHHLVPFADGGPTDLENLALRCRAHNRFESDRWFGAWRGATSQHFSGFAEPCNRRLPARV